MSKETKLKKDIYQSKKITMKSTTLNLSVEALDGSLPKSIEIILQNSSKKRKLEEKLRPQPLLLRNPRVKREKKVKVVVTPKKEEVMLKKRKKKRRRL